MSEESIFQQLEICQKQLDNALPQLAALREELAECKRRHLRSCQIAIGKSQLSKERLMQLDFAASHAENLQQRLADAERRNSDCATKLELAASMMDDDERGNRFAEVCRLAIAALNPKQGAKQ